MWKLYQTVDLGMQIRIVLHVHVCAHVICFCGSLKSICMEVTGGQKNFNFILFRNILATYQLSPWTNYRCTLFLTDKVHHKLQWNCIILVYILFVCRKTHGVNFNQIRAQKLISDTCKHLGKISPFGGVSENTTLRNAHVGIIKNPGNVKIFMLAQKL